MPWTELKLIDEAGAGVALRAAASVLEQRRRGSRETARELYYGAYSLLRTLRQHLVQPRHAAA